MMGAIGGLGCIFLTPEQFKALLDNKIVPGMGMKAVQKDMWCPACQKGLLVYDSRVDDGGILYYCNNCFKFNKDYSAS